MKEKEKNQWQSSIDEKIYKFDYKRVGLKHRLMVNDEEIIVKRESTSLFVRLDEPFFFDGKEARLVKKGKKVDVVYNDIYLRSGERYFAIPGWAWFFVGLCLLMPIISGGRVQIGLAIVALLGTFLYRRIMKKKIPSFVNEGILLILIIRGFIMGILWGLLGACLCIRASRGKENIILKVIVCVVIVVLSWFLFAFTHGVLVMDIYPLLKSNY